MYRLAQFLGVDTHCTRDFINKIASLCSLHLMREEKVTAESVSFWRENTVGMYRKGNHTTSIDEVQDQDHTL